MPNRLAEATSPYLQQHRDNPVDWWEWSPEALETARTLDRPILLSVGYAACHWCHVMAHESFEDAATAAYMNDHFVNIKVDREERPDIDAVYMQATQAMTGHGGWPMTCVLTPEGEPFFAGTYFPPEPRQGAPAFSQVLQALADAWENRRDEVLTVSQDVLNHLKDTAGPTGGPLGTDQLDEAVATLAGSYDQDAGGFGASPKFPPSMVLEFLLRNAARTGSQQAMDMVAGTCEAMARGGMYDQLTGGFARYSVDRYWRVPHFEKMLYDNALLLRVYLHWWRASGSPLAERVVRETGRFLLDELRTPEGGFASALDADSDGHEGTFYVFNPNQLMRTLGAADGAWAAQLLSVTGPGTFERGFSTLQLLQDPDDDARWQDVRARLVAARAERTRPARDDKVVASWNGMAISALAEAGVLLDEPDFTAAAVTAAELIHDVHLADGFRRTSRDGVAGTNAAVLEDHGAVAEAFLAVLGVNGDAVWLDRARLVLDRVVEHFADPAGGFFDTADDAETLVVRPQDASDNAYPSGTSAAMHALIALAAITGDHRYREAAESGIAAASSIATQLPRFAGWTLAAAEALVAGPLEVAVVGAPEQRTELHRGALSLTSPGAVVVAGEPGLAIPLFDQRDLVDGDAAAYVCRGFVCQRPVTTVTDLQAAARS
ncbi:thioredoxin domain-containing protein [Aeromicrobium chenweiae]|uniref:N-acylglucosamine 2-epimerase n=1 Tax=Aeromicrobium chenweiae TaxID=2079793 RepID=A0A2S0WP65_9ACTN|nr:thioredoxin domain-containing protein [Aeromicrobium chenweiae]AWB93101.1 N-acylglucosamine 2-epimerase [Aeromicrobium chenweiae]TGN34089.1 thioredoxin domain-containing protein [Aeromicrobium chenweiae]